MAKLFVSYSRKDSEIARRLNQALQQMGQDVWIDWEDIPPATDWLEQIFRGIEASDAFIFLVSPDSVASEVCKVEVTHAAKNNKRIIPVVLKDVRPVETIDIIRKLNWLFVRNDEEFVSSQERLRAAIELDFEWVAEHSRLQTRALEWERRKEASLLLRGADLRSARTMVTNAAKKDPKPSDLQKTYILHSSRNERNRLLVITLATIAVVAMGILSYAAVAQSRRAEEQRVIAEQYAAEAQANAVVAEANAKKAEANARKAIREKQAAEKAKRNAEDSKDLAAAQRSAARAQIFQFRPGELYTSTLLAVASWQTRKSSEAEEILRENISLLPLPVRQMTHTGSINSITFNPDGSWAVTAGADGTICVWQVSDGDNIFCVDSPGPVNDAVFSPSDPLIVSGDDTGTVQIINTEDRTVEKLIQFDAPIKDVDIQRQGTYAAVTGEDGKITLIDLKKRERSGIDLEGINIKFASFSPNGAQIASGSTDGVVSIWALAQTNNVIATRKHRGEILTLAFSPDGKYLVTGGADGAAVVMEAKTGKELFRCLSNDQVKDIAFNPKGTWFVTVSNDRTVRVWDIFSGRQLLSMAQSNFVETVQVSEDGEWIATTGDDKTVRVWSARTGVELFQIPVKGQGSALGFSKDGKYLMAGNRNGNIFIWDITSIATPAKALQFDGVTATALYSPSGRWIAASDDRRVWLLRPETIPLLTTAPSGAPIAELRSNITKLVFSPKEKWVGILSAGNEFVLYNTQTFTSRTIRTGNPVRMFAFSPAEDKLIVGGPAGKLQIVDIVTGAVVSEQTIGENTRITGLTAGVDLLVVGTDNSLHVLDLNTLQILAATETDSGHDTLALNVDASLLASINSAGQTQIWEYANGQLTPRKTIESEFAVTVAFSPTSNLIALGSEENTYLFNLETAEEFTRIPHSGTVTSVSFSPDGSALMTASLRFLQFWDTTRFTEINEKNIADVACGRLLENFSLAQWETLFETEEFRPICDNLTTPQ